MLARVRLVVILLTYRIVKESLRLRFLGRRQVVDRLGPPLVAVQKTTPLRMESDNRIYSQQL
jgi:hypothetical protein